MKYFFTHSFWILVIVFLAYPCLAVFSIIQSYVTPYGVSGAVEAESVYALAIQKKDISICDKVHIAGFADVTDSELRAVCYNRYASANTKPEHPPLHQ